MEMSIITILVTVLISIVSVAREPLKTPSYQVLIDAQFACSNKPIEPYKFVRRSNNEPFNEVAPKIWGVVKDVSLTDRKSLQKYDDKTRSFRLKYTKMGLFRCGKPIEELTTNGLTTETLLVVYPAYKKPGFFDTTSDDPEEVQNNYTLIDYTMVRDGANDGPAVPGRVGMPCLVKLDDVLKNPKSLNLDILCKGESKKSIEFTKKEVDRAIKLWRSAASAEK